MQSAKKTDVIFSSRNLKKEHLGDLNPNWRTLTPRIHKTNFEPRPKKNP